MNMPLLTHRYMGAAPPRSGLKHTFIAPYGAFDCASGQVLLSVQSNREFVALCEQVLEQPNLPKDPRFVDNPNRYANRNELDAIVTKAFSNLNVPQVMALLDRAGIANAQLNSVADLSDHPVLSTSEAVTCGTQIELAALPVRGETLGPTHVPALGEHTAAIRAEFSAQARKAKTL
jgi:formyl-CoA transferase